MNPREDILKELQISRKSIAAGQKVIPRFLIYTPAGKHTVMMPLPDDPGLLPTLFRIVWLFMAWQAATGFILSIETGVPDSVTATLVSRGEVAGATQNITRGPLKFDEPVWYGREQLDCEVMKLLPPRSVQLTTADLATIQDFLEANPAPGVTWSKPRDDED